MTGRSISNLAWPNVQVASVAPRLRRVGLEGVEIAPTAVWPDAPNVEPEVARRFAEQWRDNGIAVSGIQSLLFGHPEYQLFDRSTWPDLRRHLVDMVRLAELLDSHVAVFGSPKNRVRGEIPVSDAHHIAAEFFTGLLPVLNDCDVVLTLEPNAPAYGADYLTHYSDVVELADLIGSPSVQPQVDTGCLQMVADDPVLAVARRMPAHVHVSVPALGPPPGTIDHKNLSEALLSGRYQGWVVLEMLPDEPSPLEAAIRHAQWLTGTYPSGESIG